jgi:hypothetical protein
MIFACLLEAIIDLVLKFLLKRALRQDVMKIVDSGYANGKILEDNERGSDASYIWT